MILKKRILFYFILFFLFWLCFQALQIFLSVNLIIIETVVRLPKHILISLTVLLNCRHTITRWKDIQMLKSSLSQ